MHPNDLGCHPKFERHILPTGSARSWKYGKSHVRLDPTLRMREVVHALNRVPMCAKPLAFHREIFSVKKRFFRSIV